MSDASAMSDDIAMSSGIAPAPFLPRHRLLRGIARMRMRRCIFWVCERVFRRMRSGKLYHRWVYRVNALKILFAVSIKLRCVASNVICQHVKFLLYQCLSDDIIVKNVLDILFPGVTDKLRYYVSFRTEFGLPLISIWSLLVNDTRSHVRLLPERTWIQI